MSVAEAVLDWMDGQSLPGTIWFAKKLAANDTLALKSHQAGPYIPKEVAFTIFPELRKTDVRNPDRRFELHVDSHIDVRQARVIYYNGRLTKEGGTRNETRLTNLGGQQSALLDPDNTGSLVVFAFRRDHQDAVSCHVWVCRSETETELVESLIGFIEPGDHALWKSGHGGDAALTRLRRGGCNLELDEIPPEWLIKFPTGATIIRETAKLCRETASSPDRRLLARRKCEFEIFRSIERAFFMPRISLGFNDVDAFLKLAQAMTQSRRSRSGNSLELHLRMILEEEGLKNGVDFQYKPKIEGNKQPDFLFPSKSAYENPGTPVSRLKMLGIKTTCKDRWRQVLNEASRIANKHVLTLQEGVSENQHREMREANVTLVAPLRLHEKFPKNVRPHLMTLESFIADVRLLTI